MRFPWWSRSPKRSTVHALRKEIEEGRREIEADRREIDETKSIVDEAVKRTNQSFIEVEKNTRLAALEVALMRDINEGINGHAG